MFNNYFATQWKFAKIIMLSKPDNAHTTPRNFLPISLLNSLAKVLEKILLKILSFKLKELNLIREDQYGFKEGHSTTHTLTRVIERSNNKATPALFMDIETAFDKVWITGLMCRLIKVGIPAHFIHLIHNYLSNRTFTVLHGNSESTRRPIQAGVPQGSLLGPVLFNIYTNGIPSVENDLNVAISIYAYDKNITVRSGNIHSAANKLSNAIKSLEPWFKKWRIKINVNKCNAMLFSKLLTYFREDLTRLKIFHTKNYSASKG
jgi:hypothetical protein